MKKSLIALAAVGAFAGSAMAQSTSSSLTIYGIIDLGLVKQSKADDYTTGAPLGGAGIATKQVSVNQATKSRLGFRGVEDLGGGLSAKFELEHRLLPDTGATNTSGGNQFWDKSIVGLTSKTYGEVTIGRDYGPTFYVQYLLDPWLNQGIAEVGGTTYAFAGYNTGGHNTRYNNGIFYKAIYEGLTVMVAGAPSETYGKDARLGLGLMYNAGPLGVYAAVDREASAFNAKETDQLIQLGASYDFGVIKPRILYATSSVYSAFTKKDFKPKSLTLSATVPVSTGLIKVGYAMMNWDAANPVAQAKYAGDVAVATAAGKAADALAAGTAGATIAAGKETKQQKFSLGYEHTLSKRTALYTDVTFGKTKDADNVNGVDFGIRHSF
jgi:predicted porin